MGHEDINSKGHNSDSYQTGITTKKGVFNDFVLEKNIFNNVFEKDIRRVFIYKKAERLAKALHLITPAFAETDSLKERIDTIAVGLIDAAILPLTGARRALSRELLALSSVVSIARTGGLLSTMNADLITHEAHLLLQEVAAYEEPRVLLDDAPTLSILAKQQVSAEAQEPDKKDKAEHKRHIKDVSEMRSDIKDRQGSIVTVIKNKGKASIKDISTVIRNVSEKTIQRELAALIKRGAVLREGDRRWTLYSVAE